MINYNQKNKEIYIYLKVAAGSSCNKIDRFINIDSKSYLKIYINAVPEHGKANKEIIKFLSKKLKIRQQDIEIIKGHMINFKTILIKNIEPDYLNSILSTYIK